MPKRRYNTEEIIHKLREAEVLLGQGKSVSQVCKQLGVSCTSSKLLGPQARFS